MTLENSRPDTIVALSSAPGKGAIAVIRLSGPDSWDICRGICPDKKKFDNLPAGNTALLRAIHPSSGEYLDSMVIVKYRSPHSFTGEDMAELFTHGGISVPLAVIEALNKSGARPAQEGEFSRRAFLNGKMDLSQAEAVDDLINSRVSSERKLALSALSGGLKTMISELRDKLVVLKAELEYDLDFPDEQPIANFGERLAGEVGEIKATIDGILENAKHDLLFSRGALVVIAGRPNVGKSSLFNRLVGNERSIVTEIPGTTRDTIEMEVDIDGYLFRFADTAGLHESADRVENIGMQHSRQYLEKADILLLVQEAEANQEAESVFSDGNYPGTIINVLNKIDLLANCPSTDNGAIGISALKGTGLDKLREALLACVRPGENNAYDYSLPRITRARQKALLEHASACLTRIDLSHSSVYIAADIEEASQSLAEITGAISSEDILNSIFSSFCIGK